MNSQAVALAKLRPGQRVVRVESRRGSGKSVLGHPAHWYSKRLT
jgi:hypothetical protein